MTSIYRDRGGTRAPRVRLTDEGAGRFNVGAAGKVTEKSSAQSASATAGDGDRGSSQITASLPPARGRNRLRPPEPRPAVPLSALTPQAAGAGLGEAPAARLRRGRSRTLASEEPPPLLSTPGAEPLGRAAAGRCWPRPFPAGDGPQFGDSKE